MCCCFSLFKGQAKQKCITSTENWDEMSAKLYMATYFYRPQFNSSISLHRKVWSSQNL